MSNNCRCECHFSSGVLHVMECCDNTYERRCQVEGCSTPWNEVEKLRVTSVATGAVDFQGCKTHMKAMKGAPGDYSMGYKGES
jgi:hypothetical protein